MRVGRAVGAHLSGLALNHELRFGSWHVRAQWTRKPVTRCPAALPSAPGLVRVAQGRGHAMAAAVWARPAEAFDRFVAHTPAPLGIGTLRRTDRTRPKGL